ncbi:MAG: DUF6491 family protein [Xanthomonadales bacterium]|nr:DUF6491 family protein [Xanthomonadales bacterium]
MHVKFLTPWALIALLVSACATTQDDDLSLKARDKPSLGDLLKARNLVVEGPVNRIPGFRLNSWQYLDDYHVIITSGVRDRYLVTLRTYCFHLDSAIRIGFTSSVGSLTSADSLLVSGPGGSVERCSIRSIDRLRRTDREQSAS